MKYLFFLIILASCAIKPAHYPELTADQVCEVFNADSVAVGGLRSFDVWANGTQYDVLKAGKAGYRVYQITIEPRLIGYYEPTTSAKEYERRLNALLRKN